MNVVAPSRKGASHVIAPADLLAVRHCLAAMFAQEPLSGIDEDLRGTAEIVIAEALNNIVEHAYAGQSGAIFVSVHLAEDGLECAFTDHGAAMPDNTLPPGKLHDLGNIADLPDGGFGWYLIRALVQDLQYSRACGQNFLRFRLPIAVNAAGSFA
jgi:serine/threonine-protein kinase RsbW